MAGLTNRGFSAILWGAGGAAFKMLLQLGTQVFLARTLGPNEYGIFAIGVIVISLSNFFSDIGLAYGLIQKKEINDSDVRFVFSWQVITGSLVSIAVFFTSHSVAEFFSEPLAENVLRALAVVCLINALAAPSNNILKRRLDFKRIQISQLLGYVVGYVLIGVPLAILGFGVWSLVIAWIVQSAVLLIYLFARVRHKLTPLVWYVDASNMLNYGGKVLGTNIVNWIIGNIDRVIVGRFFTTREIGFYSTSYNLVQGPTSALLGAIQQVFFSVSSRVSEDSGKISTGYQALLNSVCVFLFPAFLLVALSAEPLILTLYGPEWAPAVDVFRPLVLAMPFYIIWGLTTPLLWTAGQPEREVRTQIPIAILWMTASAVAATFSIAAVAWVVLLLFVARMIITMASLAKIISIDWGQILTSIRAGVLVSLPLAIVVPLIDYLTVDLTNLNRWNRLLIDFTTGFAVYVISVAVFRGLIGKDLGLVLQKISTQMPPLLGRFLKRMIRRS